ncbi:MAG: glycine zipper 2TM domain-containing protein [Zoogloea sp.]|nr:glycine zipper 2TM domain-containing protein [Zoogloea sp.]
MSTHKTPTLHPMLWLAAASVTAVSLAGVAKLAGFMPAPDEAPVASLAAVPTPVAEPAPVPAARPVSPAHEAKPPRPVAAARDAARPAPVVSPPPADAVPAPPAAMCRVADAPPAVCRECGVIESIEAVQQKGEGSGLGAVGGAILGGVLGHQVGEGSGKQIARIGGAVLGGFAGNEVEKRYRAISHYRIGVRMEDGSYRVVEQQNAPAWRRGDAVRLEGGGIVPGGAAPAAGSSAF